MKSLLLAALALLNACSDVPDELGLDHEGYVHTAELRFDCGLSRFDAQTRATISSWDDGARVYIQFLGNGRVSGYATYQKSTDAWTLYFGDALTQGQTAACEVYYFESPATSSSSSVTFTAESTVYADKAATYLYKNGVMTLLGHLKPQTGRVRFKGTAGTSFALSGLKWYSAYDASTGSLSQTNGQMRLTIGANGYSQYVYADFNNSATRQLSITNGSEGTYEKSFSSNVLSVGKSGYISVPTQANHNGWKLSETETNQTFIVNGVLFKMIKVEGGTFQMGSTSDDSDERPVHQVTLTNDYYIGETEVTQELWTAVMGSNPSSFTSSNKLPVESVSWDDCQNFITKLNALTGRTFRLPTEAEWEFAARGGNASKGYTYSGSNSIGDVAWYYDNSSSTTHEVATKAPNELGIYDMSGNVWEWCQDWYGSYSSEAQTNPAGPTSGSSRVHRGGSWYSGDDCRVADRAELSASYTVYNLGLRLALAEGQDVTSHTSAAPNALSFDASANSAGKVVTVTSNEGWTATSNTAWCKVSPASGTNNGSVTVTLTANTSSSSRTATVTIKGTTSGDATTINVVQSGGTNANSQTFTVNGVPFNMVKVEGGTFQMGGNGEYDGMPIHQVTLTNDYYIGETEVTQELWTAVMGSNPSYFKSSNKLPVEEVSWNDCQTFITKLNALTGRTFRLPTEAEWEFAARGGNASKGYTYSGSNAIGDVAWYDGNSSGKTHEVATKSPNELGIYDMSGNVWEWCQDWYGSYSSSAQTNPTGPTSGSYRVIRGGGWSYSDYNCRVAIRNGDAPSGGNYNRGLRLAL